MKIVDKKSISDFLKINKVLVAVVSLAVLLSDGAVLSQALAVPNISIAPSTYDFGPVLPGYSNGTNFTVSNIGTDPLVISNVNIVGDVNVCMVMGCPVNDSNAFNIDFSNCGTVLPSSACTVGVSFTPYSGTSGVKVSNLYVTSNDPDTPSLATTLDGFEDVDLDADSIPDSVDVCFGNNASGDTDADGVCDSNDICAGGDDKVDTDGDGTPDFCDACPLDNPDDTDLDGVCDSDDPCPLDNPDDTDADGTCDSNDLCPGSDDKIDTDNDLVPDGCDVFPTNINEWADTDSDTVGDNADVCPGGDDTVDTDSDTVPDDCDEMPSTTGEWKDTDLDGVGDNEDNCVTVANAGNPQLDSDGDAIGDACDASPNTPNYGNVMDAPHNSIRGITCVTCHTFSIWWQYSPMEQDSQYSTRTNNICYSCHGTGIGSINEVHSASAMGSSHRSALGDWSSKCVDCHDPHRQEQLDWRSTDTTNLYLITGLFGDNTTINTSNGQTIISDYTVVSENNMDWSDPSTWGQKDTSPPPNGLILVQDTTDAINTFEIISADASTITVKGGVDPNEAAYGSFGLIYGRLIRSSITIPNSEVKDTKFFESAIGGYTDVYGSGLCQVCHTDTYYWINDGSKAGHYDGDICVSCHKHSLGFKSYGVDTEPPVITLIGSSSVNAECNVTYTDQGSNVTDNSSIDLTATVTGTVSTSPLGAISTLYYNVQDNAGNDAAEVTRDVTVHDTTIPILTLNGSHTVILPLGDTYTEDNATATDTCGISGAVTIGGAFNTSVSGTYELTYDVEDGAGNTAEQVTRTVIVDGEAPVITLIGSSSEIVECAGAYTDPGATVTDNVDSGLVVTVTGSVDVYNVGGQILYYNVQDNQGNNATQLTRDVTVQDTVAPVITLNGSSFITIPKGDIYIEEGSSVSESCSSPVVATIGGDTVDTSTLGTYIVTYDVQDDAGNSAVQLTRIVQVVFADAIPDTGQTTSYTTTFGEDHDYTINQQSYTLNGDGTTTDHVTGLMWQSEDDNSTYNWYEASGTADATYNPGGAIDVCGDLSLASHTDWRLPTEKELQQIVDYETFNPAINQTAFPGTESWLYWSSVSRARSPTTYGLGIDFGGGGGGGGTKSANLWVRCVRGEQLSFGNFIDNGDGTVSDMDTVLVWQQQDDDVARNWEEALAYCENLELPTGQNDWRLPNIKELKSIVDSTRFNPAINQTAFLGTKLGYYWSSTTQAFSPSYARYIDFMDGMLSQSKKTYKSFDIYSNYVRCVRGGQ